MLLDILKSRFSQALSELVADSAPWLDHIRPAQNATFGDYQANMAMPLAKTLGRPPREIAAEIVAKLDVADILEPPEIAGPGFINLRFRADWLARGVESALTDDHLAVKSIANPKTIVIDFSAPNVAKPMHVGHIRSTMIGNSLVKILRFLGHKVIADNHIGDWGTQFGMIIYGYRHFLDEKTMKERPVYELGRLYRLVRQLVDYQSAGEQLTRIKDQLAQKEEELSKTTKELATLKEAVAQKDATKKDALKKANRICEAARLEIVRLTEEIEGIQAKIAAVESNPELKRLSEEHPEMGPAVLLETSKLHHGDPDNRKLWNDFLPACLEDMNRVYDRLGVHFDTAHGESFYNDRLGPLVDRLKKEGIAVESHGAVCIFLEGQEVPMLIQKKDGAFLYATTDLATIGYRHETWKPDSILYVVDFRQSLHFNQLFAAAKKIGYTDMNLVHVKFGTVLGEDGRPFKTRSGDTVGLESLLDEAQSRALKIVTENENAKKDGAGFTEEERMETARRIGNGALVYADLSQNRESDYVFSYDKMLAMTGNTATYMQYAYARIRSIFTKGGIDPDTLLQKVRTDSTHLLVQPTQPQERALILAQLRFAEALESVAKDYRPNLLTSYLYDLANAYSSFFESCPVLKAEDDTVRTSRLLLCLLTAQTIRKGLELLGIQTVDKM